MSADQAEVLCGAAGADPEAEQALLGAARRVELGELRKLCARTRASAENDAARAERLWRQRSVRTWCGPDGSWNLAARHSPEVGAEIEAALAPLRQAAAERAGGRRDGPKPPRPMGPTPWPRWPGAASERAQSQPSHARAGPTPRSSHWSISKPCAGDGPRVPSAAR